MSIVVNMYFRLLFLFFFFNIQKNSYFPVIGCTNFNLWFYFGTNSYLESYVYLLLLLTEVYKLAFTNKFFSYFMQSFMKLFIISLLNIIEPSIWVFNFRWIWIDWSSIHLNFDLSNNSFTIFFDNNSFTSYNHIRK